MPQLILCSDDLMFAGKVSGTAAAYGLSYRSIGSLGAWLELAADELQIVQLVLLDLDGVASDPEPWVEAIRQSAPQAEIVAFGPHVAGAKLDAARAAGCDQVLTRGQFQQQFGPLIARFATKT